MLDCDYKPVYLNHRVIENTAHGLHYNQQRAEDMMMVIRVNQIKSLSLFDPFIYKEFEYKGASQKFIVD